MKSKILITATVFIALLLVLSVALNIRQNYTLEQKEAHFEDLIMQGSQNKVADRYIKDSITHTAFSEKLISNGIAEKKLAMGKSYTDSLQRALKTPVDKIS